MQAKIGEATCERLYLENCHRATANCYPDNCHLGQIPPGKITTQDNCLPDTCYCCNHSAWVALKCAVRHERIVREEQHHIYVARTSNNRVIAVHDPYCCLLPQCEALRTCHSGFPIATLPRTSATSDKDHLRQLPHRQPLSRTTPFRENYHRGNCNSE